MRKIGLVSCILLFISSVVTAQEVRFGLKGGVNISSASQEYMQHHSKTSFHLGGMMEALYNERIAIQTEIIFSMQGFEFMDNNVERDFKLSYINVPCLLNYYIFDGVSVAAGPQLGFLNSAKLTSTSLATSEEIDIKDGLRSTDLSLNMGLGFQLKNGLNINARYCYGLTNISGVITEKKIKNRVMQVSIGYFF